MLGRIFILETFFVRLSPLLTWTCKAIHIYIYMYRIYIYIYTYVYIYIYTHTPRLSIYAAYAGSMMPFSHWCLDSHKLRLVCEMSCGSSLTCQVDFQVTKVMNPGNAGDFPGPLGRPMELRSYNSRVVVEHTHQATNDKRMTTKRI